MPIYSEVFFDRNVKFQYPPSSLFALMAMQAMAPPQRVRITDQDVYAWPTVNDISGWLFLLLTAAATAALLERRLREQCRFDDTRTLIGLRVAIVFGLALTFYPLVKAFSLGQIQVWINGLFAVALLAWATGRRTASGALMGVLCLIKPHYGLFVLWALLRKEWRFAFACVAAGCVGLIGSLAVFGLANHLDYLPVLSHLAERGETYYPNHSVNGLLNRLMSRRRARALPQPRLGRRRLPAVQPPGLLDDHASARPRSCCWRSLRRNRDNDPGPRRRLLHHGGELHGRLADRLGASLRRAVAGVRGRAGRRAAQPRPAALADRELRARQQLFHRDAAASRRRSGISSSPICLFATWILLVLLHLRPPLPLARQREPADAPATASGTQPMNAMRFRRICAQPPDDHQRCDIAGGMST